MYTYMCMYMYMYIYLNALQEQATGTPAGVMETPTATPHTKLTEVYILLLYDIYIYIVYIVLYKFVCGVAVNMW